MTPSNQKKYNYQIVNPQTGEVVERFRIKMTAINKIHKLEEIYGKLVIQRIPKDEAS